MSTLRRLKKGARMTCEKDCIHHCVCPAVNEMVKTANRLNGFWHIPKESPKILGSAVKEEIHPIVGKIQEFMCVNCRWRLNPAQFTGDLDALRKKK